jgi:hypothetical protein
MPNDDVDSLSLYGDNNNNNDANRVVGKCHEEYNTSGHSVKCVISMAIGQKNKAREALARLYFVGTGRPDVVIEK